MGRGTSTLGWVLLALALLAVAVAALQLRSTAQHGPAVREPVGRWTLYLAPESVCRSSNDAEAPTAAQEQTMLCLIDWARGQAGVPPLARSPVLMRSALLKTIYIARCRQFSHQACGKPAGDAFERVDYRASALSTGVGENIAWGAALAGSPRHVLNAWLGSPTHRANLLRAAWREQGIALLRLDALRRRERESLDLPLRLPALTVGRVRVNDDAAAERGRVDELQVGQVEAVEQPLTGACERRGRPRSGTRRRARGRAASGRARRCRTSGCPRRARA